VIERQACSRLLEHNAGTLPEPVLGDDRWREALGLLERY
jgi:hypothetical protein